MVDHPDDARMRESITTWIPGTSIWHFRRIRPADLSHPLPEGLLGVWFVLAEDTQVPQTIGLLVSLHGDGHWEVNADLTQARLPHTTETRRTCLATLKEQLAARPLADPLWHSVRDRDLPQFRGDRDDQNASH